MKNFSVSKSLLVFSCYIFMGCSSGGGSSSPKNPLPPTPSLNLQDPGSLEVTSTTPLRTNVYSLEDSEGRFFDALNPSFLSLENPFRNYQVDDVLLFKEQGVDLAFKINQVTYSSTAYTSYQIQEAKDFEIFEQGTLEFRATANYREENIPRNPAGNIPSIDDEGVLDLAGLSFFDLQFGPNGVTEPEGSLVGIPFGQLARDNLPTISCEEGCINGFLKGKVLSGKLDCKPTFTQRKEIYNGYSISYYDLEVDAKFEVELEFESSLCVDLWFKGPMFPKLEKVVLLNVGPAVIPLCLTLEAPTTLNFSAKGNGSVRVTSKSRYVHKSKITIDSRNPLSLSSNPLVNEFEQTHELNSHVENASISAEIYPEIRAKATLLCLAGPFFWLRPDLQINVSYPLRLDVPEAILNPSGGIAFQVGSEIAGISKDFYSEDLLGLSPTSFDFLGPINGSIPSNSPPIARDLSVNAYPGQNHITLQATDANEQTITYHIKTLPLKGNLGTLNSFTGEVPYTPHENFKGLDSFEIFAFDGYEESNIATVHIIVGDDLAFFDNFESANLGNWRDAVPGGFISDEFSRSGNHSVFFPGNQSLGVIANNSLRARGTYSSWFYLESSSTYAFLRFYQANEVGVGANYCDVVASPKGFQSIPSGLRLRCRNGNGAIISDVEAPVSIPVQEWFKLTVNHFSDNSMRVFVDDQLELDEFHVLPNPVSAALTIGGGGDQGFFLDDVSYIPQTTQQ